MALTRCINPLFFQESEEKIFLILLNNIQKNNECLRPNIYYTLTFLDKDGEKKPFFVSLTHRVFRRESISRPCEYRYEVVDDEARIGNTVYRVLATLEVKQNRIIVKKTHQRVVKIQKFAEEETIWLEREFDMLCHVGLFRVKNPAYQQISPPIFSTFMTMRRIPGESLFSIIEKCKTKNLILSADEFFELSIAILRAIKRQVHDSGLVHRDIKPENIMVFRSDNRITVTIIDYGLSKFQNENDAGPDTDNPGSEGYAPPESYSRKGTTPLSDVFSAAITLKELFGGNALEIDYEFIDLYQFSDLFCYVPLEEKYQSEIKKTLLKMLHYERDHRITLDQAIAEFENIRFNSLIASVDSQNSEDFCNAWCRAQEARKMVEQHGRHSLDFDVALMMGGIRGTLMWLNDSPFTIFWFKKLLRIQAFSAAESKDDLLKICEDGLNNYKAIIVISEQLENQLKRLDEIKAKMTDVDGLTEIKKNMDMIEQFNENLSKRMSKTLCHPDELMAFIGTMKEKAEKMLDAAKKNQYELLKITNRPV